MNPTRLSPLLWFLLLQAVAAFKDINNNNKGPLKVLFLSSDTGGGHRASCESLAAQFQKHFPGSSYDLLDVWVTDGVWPWSTLVDSYTRMSARPREWKFLFHFGNIWPQDVLADRLSDWMCGRAVRKRIASYDPDVVVSVHPTMTGGPSDRVVQIARRLGKHVPFYTVCSDLGSAHATWFNARRTDKLYVASERVRRLAKSRGRYKDDQLVMTGLPIRQAFAELAEQLGDRTSPEGKAFQLKTKRDLEIIDTEKPMVLVMGGGEGVGGLEQIVDGLYAQLHAAGVPACIYVVCGRNEKLKESLATKDWGAVVRGKKNEEVVAHNPDLIKVIGLGYVTQMAEYMVAADVLVTKAGPGTIAEAASVGLPCMLTSFLPGQEAGNVDIVVDKEFGVFQKDPNKIGRTVAEWLKDANGKLATMSRNALKQARPNAAAEIAMDIGTAANAWKSLGAHRPRMSDLEW